jgi:OOP family OmpA-OmpF porin
MRLLVALVATILALGCASPSQEVKPLAATPMVPRANEEIVVDNLLIIVDTSASITRPDPFQEETTLVQSFVRAAPDGNYHSGQIVFGGEGRQATPLSRFDRVRMADAARRIEFLDQSTELHEVLDEARSMLLERPGRTAIVVFSDGRPTAYRGSQPGKKMALHSARQIAAARSDTTCFFTVQSSEDPAGAAFLKDLSRVTSCGSFRAASSLRTVGALHAFERSIFFPRSLPAVSAAPPDRDADGVPDARDRCPESPRGNRTTSDGCWLAPAIYFRHDSSAISETAQQQLFHIAKILEQHPGFEVRIDGHADSSGTKEYNQALADRRAQAAQSYIEMQGINPDRFVVRAFGESSPRLPNDTPPNRSGNRRVEFSRNPK